MCNVNVSTTVRKTYFLRKPLRIFNVSSYVQKYVNVNAALVKRIYKKTLSCPYCSLVGKYFHIICNIKGRSHD